MKRQALKKLTLTTCITSILAVSPFVIPVASTTLLPNSAQAAVISNISVVGNQVIPSETIRDFAGVNLGSNLTPPQINEVLRRLYDSGMFENVDLSVVGSTMVITVVENSSVSVVAFEGNKSIKDEVLASVVQTSARTPYNRLTAEADAQRITQLYSQAGRTGAVVRPVIIPGTAGQVNVVFEVTESAVSSINRVSFLGNSHISDRRLRSVIDTNEANFLSFLLGRSTVDAGQIDRDRQNLTDFYTNKGFVDFEILSAVPELSADRSAYFLTYTIREGFKYDFGDASVSSSVNGVDASGFQRFVNINQGRTYRAKDVRAVVERIEAEAVRLGLPFLRVSPRYTKNDSNRTVAVNFELVNGRRVYVERIDIGGNTSTRENVIRRQFDFVEGDAFNSRKLAEAADKLRSLGIFGATNVTIREGSSPDKAIVDVEVQDIATGSLGFGATYSSDGGISGSITLSERNFLGRGQAYNFELSVGEKSEVFAFSFTEPYLFGRDLSATASFYYRNADRSESSFQTTSIGFEPSIGFALGENTKLRLNYRLSMNDIRDVHADASPIISAEAGNLLTSAIGASLTYDRRNSRVTPTAGYFLTVNGEFAGLGGDVSYSKAVVRAKGYTSFFDESLIITAELEGGALLSNTGTRVTDRFFLGGQSLKGFSVGGIGPRDMSTVNEDSLGGNFYGVARLQGSFPIGLPEEYGIFGGVFLEGGSVWDLDIAPASGDEMAFRSATGVSLFWTTPIGPLEFSYAIPIQKETDDITQNFSVSIATRF